MPSQIVVFNRRLMAMKLHYYPETDSLYIDLSEKSSIDSKEITPGVVLDFDNEGNLVGIDIDRASQVVNLASLETEALPVSKLQIQA